MPQPFRAGLMLGTEQHIGRIGEPTLRDLSEALIAAYGTDYGVPQSGLDLPVYRFGASGCRLSRPADPAGDAARVHYPAGGQGLNIGVQDAVNLGWKLAQVVKGTSPDCLLNSY
jgi:3-(3-hydroxy-phenyl)propionate hydroxylase